MDKANKVRFCVIYKTKIGETDIKARIRFDDINKNKTRRANIKVDQNSSIKASKNTDNSANSGGKIINQYIRLVDFLCIVFATANCTCNSNLVVFKQTLLGTITSSFINF